MSLTISTTTTHVLLPSPNYGSCVSSFHPKLPILQLLEHSPTSKKRLKCSNPTTSFISVSYKQNPFSSKASQVPSLFRVRCSQPRDVGNSDASSSGGVPSRGDSDGDKMLEDLKIETSNQGSSFLAKLALGLGVAATVTLISVGCRWPSQGSTPGVPLGSSASAPSIPLVDFNFKVFGYPVVIPQYAPGWVYFWLLMAAGCGLFISEEALNIWVGISLARILSLDGTWKSFADSFSRNSPYIISTVLWVYWGVCISDMVPFYVGRLFRQSGASDDVYSKLGIGKEKAVSVTRAVQRYGNLIGFVERFSVGVRNPTSFLAGALGISAECFFAGVCCGGLFTLPVQLGIGFLLRERPVLALASVASVVGIWSVFPYAMAALTALFLFLRRRYSS